MKRVLIAAFAMLVSAAACATSIGTCTVAKVTDGDTLDATCTGRKKVQPLRLASIDAPELKHFTWQTQPWAAESKAALAKLCLIGAPVKVTLVTYDKRTQRWVAKAACAGVDVSEYQAAHGNAWSYLPAARSKVPALAAAAKKGRLGLWAAPSQVAPSDWRKGVTN